MLFVLVPLLVSPLYFWGLGDTYMWQDEAHTALLARHTLQYGLPYVGAGSESASALSGDDANSAGIFLHIPPLQAYVCAASFAVFGESSFSARFPFALCGWLCVLILPWACGRSVDRASALWVQLILGLHVPFLLHVRQCRYYALAALLALASLGAGFRWLQSPRSGRFLPALAALCMSLLALTFEFAWAAAAGTLGLAIAVDCLRRGVRSVRMHYPMMTALAISAGVEAIWVWIAFGAPSRRPGPGSNTNPGFPDFPWYYLGFINGYVVPLLWCLALAAALALVYAAARITRRQGLLERFSLAAPSLGIASYYAAFAFLLCLTCTYTRNHFPRYIVAAFPPAVVAAVLLHRGSLQVIGQQRGAMALFVVFMLVMASGMWTFRLGQTTPVWPWEPWLEQKTRAIWSRRTDVHLLSYLHELRHPPRGPVAFMVEYLNRVAQPADIVVAEYSEKPLKFYTNLKVYGGETGEYPDSPPQWIWRRPFLRHWREVDETIQWIEQLHRRYAYEELLLGGVIDSQWENRPHPEWHVFDDSFRRFFPHSRPYTVLLRRAESVK